MKRKPIRSTLPPSSIVEAVMVATYRRRRKMCMSAVLSNTRLSVAATFPDGDA